MGGSRRSKGPHLLPLHSAPNQWPLMSRFPRRLVCVTVKLGEGDRTTQAPVLLAAFRQHQKEPARRGGAGQGLPGLQVPSPLGLILSGRLFSQGYTWEDGGVRTLHTRPLLGGGEEAMEGQRSQASTLVSVKSWFQEAELHDHQFKPWSNHLRFFHIQGPCFCFCGMGTAKPVLACSWELP